MKIHLLKNHKINDPRRSWETVSRTGANNLYPNGQRYHFDAALSLIPNDDQSSVGKEFCQNQNILRQSNLDINFSSEIILTIFDDGEHFGNVSLELRAKCVDLNPIAKKKSTARKSTWIVDKLVDDHIDVRVRAAVRRFKLPSSPVDYYFTQPRNRSLRNNGVDNSVYIDLKTNDMVRRGSGFIAENRGFPLGDNWPCQDLAEMSGEVTVSVFLPYKPMIPKVSEQLSVCQAILQQNLASDAVIVAKDGAQIPCHKCFLIAHSSVLHAMFKSGLKESKTSIVDMSDMSEKVVRAFLAYLYYWDVNSALTDADVAFELFCAGHKYDIPKLERSMNTMLLDKGDSMFEVGLAVRLFCYVRNVDTAQELKLKAARILKLKFSELEKSTEYQDLFKNHPTAAVELTRLCFEHCKWDN